jgi:general secretion pathway protein L
MARLVGIDIDSTHVRVAALRTSYRKVALESLTEVALDGRSEEAALREAIGKSPADAIAIALAGDKCLYRRMELPRAAERELENVLAFELESSIPFEMEGAVYDKRILTRPSAVGMVTVFAAIARIDDVKDRIDLVKKATGREADVVDTGSLGLANLAQVVPDLSPASASGSAPVAVLDLGTSRAEIVVIDRGEAAFARTLSRGTFQSEAVRRDLKQSVAAWRAAGGAPLAGLYLTGSGAFLPQSEAILAADLGTPVHKLGAMELDGLTPADADRLPLFAKAIAIGLGAGSRSRSLNLRQGPLEAARSFAFLRERAPLLSGLSAVVLVSFGFSVVAELRALSTERLVLDEQLKATTAQAFGEETTDLARAQELLDKGPGAEEDPMPRVDAFDVMVELSRAVPHDVVHDVAELDVARGHAVIQGLLPIGGNAQETADKIATAMKLNPCFRDVKVQRTTQAGPEKQKYILELDLRCEDKKDPKKKTDDAAAKKEGSE